MKEIGGYFGLEQFGGDEYYSDLIAVNTARNALVYLIRSNRIKKLYIPYFLCGSVSDVCNRECCSYEYYHIGKDFFPIFDKSLKNGEYLYVVNYYGMIDNDQAVRLKKHYGNIILDNVQAFFQRPIKGIDTIYSCRKFFGVSDGGYVSTDALLNEALPVDVSMDRMRHVLGRYEGKSASDYYGEFKANDHAFVGLELRSMSRLTHNILRAINYEAIKQTREENFAFLHEKLGPLNSLKTNAPVGPYAYPFYCKNGMEIKKVLAQKKIFVATLWPNVLEFDGCELEKDYAENILPLPCDQRYDTEDMKKVIEEVLECFKN